MEYKTLSNGVKMPQVGFGVLYVDGLKVCEQAVIPKSVHRSRMEENFNVFDFALDAEDMSRIATLDKGCPSTLNPEVPSEVHRLYGYLDNPVITSLK